MKKRSAQKEQEMDCQICSDMLEGTDIYPLEGCIHIYHIDCLKEYLL